MINFPVIDRLINLYVCPGWVLPLSTFRGNAIKKWEFTNTDRRNYPLATQELPTATCFDHKITLLLLSEYKQSVKRFQSKTAF